MMVKYHKIRLIRDYKELTIFFKNVTPLKTYFMCIQVSNVFFFSDFVVPNSMLYSFRIQIKRVLLRGDVPKRVTAVQPA